MHECVNKRGRFFRITCELGESMYALLCEWEGSTMVCTH